MLHFFLQFFIHLIYFVFVVTKGNLSLNGVKILTWIWFFLIFIDVAVLLIQLAMRSYTCFHIPDFVIRKMEFQERYLRVQTMNKQLT